MVTRRTHLNRASVINTSDKTASFFFQEHNHNVEGGSHTQNTSAKQLKGYSDQQVSICGATQLLLFLNVEAEF